MNKLHHIANYIDALQGSLVRLVPEDQYARTDIGISYIKHHAGEMLESERLRIETELRSLGCTNVSVRADSIPFSGRLRIYIGVEL